MIQQLKIFFLNSLSCKREAQMPTTSEGLLQNRRLGTVLLLLGMACFFIQCARNDIENSGDPSFETYFRADSTYIGISTVAEKLDVPWEITWGPNGWIWMTEHGGTVSKIDPTSGQRKKMLKLQNVYEGTTPGLLGMVVHPNQERFPYLFLVYNSKKEGGTIYWNVDRYKIGADTLRDRKNLLKIKGGDGRQGSRIRISPKGKLIVANGVGFSNSQDVDLLAGKILRLNIDGSIPEDNPFPDSPVWAWGFKNQQGLTFGKDSILYASDHGMATDDEVSIIKKGRNHGWPTVEGYCDKPKEKAFCADSSVVEPIKAWSPTIAPSGLAYYGYDNIPEWQHSLLLTTLRNVSLHVLSLDKSGRTVEKEMVYLSDKYGRLRDVTISPEGDVYISTSNRDWKHNSEEEWPKPNDDRILRLSGIQDSSSLKGVPPIKQVATYASTMMKRLSNSKGGRIYKKRCVSCHQPDGKGIRGSFPSLEGDKHIPKARLISIVLEGKDSEEYTEKMPAFRSLSDQKVARVLTFIRSHFSNRGSKITEEQVKVIRDSISVKHDK
ncbi:Glucose/arabinose dehydrogenase, beta-propeller fold [Fodinibius roseus]|uniref:Glucose/arabinose dehydrogenase, beta-propeller fold n=1 Tax=Fodinibius roseus TaxID=1194090 RepID=A0A1M4YNL6_9BACT|nr:PQQ-dependent sugar dehydrogenase [Fodinibius roseus]SHF07405.1 Glucose/arabinose dehydrogenase, beta-propeller fold [Fodinibius roseus]